MDSLSGLSNFASLPGLALTAWEGTAPAVPAAMPLPAQPFTLWLSPDVWPRPALRLPGNAHTLWQNPDTWPRPRLRLLGSAGTLWMDESRWLAAAGPAMPATAPAADVEPAPMAAPEPVMESLEMVVIEVIPSPVEERLAEPVIVSITETLLEPAVETTVASRAEPMPEPEPAPEISGVPLPDALLSEPTPPPVAESVMNTPIKLPANHSFTLWTTPAAVAAAPPASAAPVRSKLRLPGQPFTLWTQPGRVDRIVMRNGAAAATGKTTAATRDTSRSAPRWLPLAAGIAIAALFCMGYLSQKAQRQNIEEELAQEKSRAAAGISTAQIQAKAASIKAEDALSKLTAKEAEHTSEMAMLKAALTRAEEAAKKAQTAVTGATAALDKTKKELADIKRDYSAKETTLQNNLTALTEENSKMKRLAGEEASKARESIAKLEVEKATAVKESTAAMADRDAMKAEVEKLRKQLQSPAKPPGTTEL